MIVIPSKADNRVFHIFDESQSIMNAPRLRTGVEYDDWQNLSDIDFSWWGATIYISRQELRDIRIAGGGAVLVSRILALFPKAAPASAAIGIAGAAAMFLTSVGLEYCPGGVFVRVTWLGGAIGAGCQ